MKNTLRILVMLFMVVLSGATLGIMLDVNPMIIIGALLLASFIPRPLGALTVSLVDLARPTGSNPGAGGGVKSEIILIPAENIASITYWAVDNISVADVTMKTGKYMKRFYMTSDVIEPSQKKLKGSNVDSGGWEVSIKGFYPGFGDAILSWIANYGYAFEGLLIFQNCADGKKYILGQMCNWVHVDDIQSAWGPTVEKERGNTVTFLAKQSKPLAVYLGVIKYDPTSASW